MATDSQSSPFGPIVLKLKDQIANVTGLDPAYVRVVSSDHYNSGHCAESQFIYLRVYGPQIDTDAGVGRRARRAWRTIRIYLYTRDSNDETGVDELALTAAGKHFWLEETVVDAVDEYFPYTTDSNGDVQPLTIEPLHFIDSSPGKPERDIEADVGLLRSFFDMSVSYVLPNQAVVPTSSTSFLD